MGFEPTFSTPITITCLEDRLGYQTKGIFMPSNNPDYQKNYIRQHYLNNKDYYKQKAKLRKDSLPLNQKLFEQIRQRCKKSKVLFTITPEDIVIPKFCPVFKTKFDQKDTYKRASVDRIDPNKGYTKENIRVISYRANWLKSNATLEEIEALYNFMKTS